MARNLTAIVLALLVIFGLGKPLLKKGSAALARRAETKSADALDVGGEIASALADRARSDLDMKVSRSR